jgi:Na+/H+-dicarboxylate symporter
MVGGGVGARAYLRAVAQPVAIAASTQSSMACLPALLVAARETLRLPVALVETVIPLAVSTFRFGNVSGSVAAGLIGARLCGLHPDPLHILFASLVAVLTNIGIVGLPGSAVLFAAYGPVFAVLGTPFEMLTLLVAVFALPDILDTSANVSADLSVVAIVARLARADPSALHTTMAG